MYIVLILFAKNNVKKKRVIDDLIINELEVGRFLKDVVFVEKILEQSLDPQGFNITIAETIGVSLKELFIACDKQFSLNTILMIGLKIVSLAEVMVNR